MFWLLDKVKKPYLKLIPRGKLIDDMYELFDILKYKRGYFYINNILIVLACFKGFIVASLFAFAVKLPVLIYVLGVENMDDIAALLCY
jgi:hypothetical protein